MTEDLTRIAGELEGLRAKMDAAHRIACGLRVDTSEPDEWADAHTALSDASSALSEALDAHAPLLIAALLECAAWRAQYRDSSVSFYASPGEEDIVMREWHRSRTANETRLRAVAATDAAVRDTTERSK